MNSSGLVQRSIGGTAAGLILGILATTQTGLQAESRESNDSDGVSARIISRLGSASYGTYLEPYSGSYSRPTTTVEEDIAEAYQAFASMQQSLDVEIATVLESSLWELYVR